MQHPASWDVVAAGYAEEVVGHTRLYAAEALRLVALAPTARVLDVGAGPGALTLLVAPRVARVDAIDFSPQMIAELSARAERDGVTNVTATVMDAQALAFEDGSFDAAFCFFAFMFFPDRPRAFGELHRVLVPGARAVVGTWAPIDRRPLMKLGFEAIGEAIPELPLPQKGDLQAPDECVREMSAAGFRDVTCQPFTASLHVASVQDYLRMLTRSGAGFDAVKKRLGEAAWALALDRLLAALKKRIPEGGTDLAAEALLTVGTRA